MRLFLDTNVLLYAYDPRDAIKLHTATTILERVIDSRLGVVSAQVLAEFFSIATRKLGMAPPVAEARIAAFTRSFLVVAVTSAMVQEAIRTSIRFRISFWDAQVLAAARSSDVTTVLSEDLQHGAKFDGIQVLNPFRAEP